MTLFYPGLGGKPIIAVAIKCGLTGRGYYSPMVLDTGADETCFPAAFAKSFGHRNDHSDVEVQKDAVQGIGGMSDSFIHSVQIGLLHPSKSTTKTPVIALMSPLKKAPFVEKLDCPHGLIGMDIIGCWKSLYFEPTKKGLKIIIRV